MAELFMLSLFVWHSLLSNMLHLCFSIVFKVFYLDNYYRYLHKSTVEKRNKYKQIGKSCLCVLSCPQASHIWANIEKSPKIPKEIYNN